LKGTPKLEKKMGNAQSGKKKLKHAQKGPRGGDGISGEENKTANEKPGKSSPIATPGSSTVLRRNEKKAKAKR